jgi:hypothetical protein
MILMVLRVFASLVAGVEIVAGQWEPVTVRRSSGSRRVAPLPVEQFEQGYGDPAGGTECLAGLADRERLRQSGEHAYRLVGRAGQQHDALGDAQQRPGPDSGGGLTGTEARRNVSTGASGSSGCSAA